MLTTRLNDATFIIGSATYTAGQPIQLTADEQTKLSQLVSLAPVLRDQKPVLMNLCHSTEGAYNKELAVEFFNFEQTSRDFTYISSTLMHNICQRLGGMLPLSINTEAGSEGVFVRPIGNPNESVVLTTDIVRKASRFSSLIGDVRSFIAALIKPTAIEEAAVSSLTLKSANWPLMGAPYVKTKTELLTMPFNSADEWDSFKWSAIENSAFDRTILDALGASLSHENRLGGVINGSAPFRNITLLIGEKETLGLNLSEVPDDMQRTQLLKREATRVKAKYLLSTFFGPLSNEGSTHDFNKRDDSRPEYGFMMHIVMRSSKSDNLLIGGRAWRIEGLPDGTHNLAVYATYEGNIGLADPKINDTLEHIMAASRAKPQLEVVR